MRAEVASAEGGELIQPSPRERSLGLLRVVCGALLFVLVLAAVARGWDEVRSTISLIEPHELALAEVLILAGLTLSVLTWRQGLAEVGLRVRFDAAARIYLLGQLGKYLPGSVWALAAQAEFAKAAGVPRARGIAASVIAIGVNVVTGLAIGVALVPSLADGGHWRTVLLVAGTGICAYALSPPALTRLVNLGLRLARREPLDRAVTWRGIARASGWSIASWLCYGLSLWALAVSVGAPAGPALPLCVAGVSVAMTVGFLVVVTPSGLGVREAIIVGALAPALDRSDALAVALVARLLFTIADLVAAAAVVGVRVRQSEAA
jgi:uncharacterized membrane protein YbhN (UPF0104 family)